MAIHGLGMGCSGGSTGGAALASNLGVRRSLQLFAPGRTGRPLRLWRAALLVAGGLLLSSSTSGAEVAPIELNTASQLELESLPGIGPKVAIAIIERRTGAPFEKVEELLDIRGIGPKMLENLRPKVVVSAAAVD